MTATIGLALLASRGRAIEKLLEGDPTSWVILAIVVVIFGAISVVKARKKKEQEEQAKKSENLDMFKGLK